MWNFTTVLITAYVNAITLADPGGPSKDLVNIEPRAKDEILVLKELTWHYVILNHELAAVQHGQREAIRSVFMTMIQAAADKNKWSIFPLEHREELGRVGPNAKKLKRAVTDFVAGMTEREIQSLYRSLRGRA